MLFHCISRNQPNEIDHTHYVSMFNFLRNEDSVSLRIAMLLYLSLAHCSVKVVPYLNVSIPFTKRGPLPSRLCYNEIITSWDGDKGNAYFVLETGKLLMIIEVKTTVNSNFFFVNLRDVIELAIYCQHMMRIHKVSVVLGTLSDGRVWHTIQFSMEKDMLDVKKYTNVVARDDKEVILAIPNINILALL